MGLFSFLKKSGKQEAIEPLQLHQSDKLPQRIEDFRAEHYKVLRRLKNHPVNEPFSGLMTLEVDIPNFIPVLINLGLVKIGTYEEALNALKSDALKEILKCFGMKVSGSKAVLVERIIDNIAEDEVRALDIYSDIYVHTEITKSVIDASYDKFDEERNAFFQKAMDYILSGEIDAAYRMICKRNAEMPVPPGIGCDWEKWYHSGLKKADLEIYENQLRNSSSKTITAMAIYQIIGGTLRGVKQYQESTETDRTQIRTAQSTMSEERHRQEYTEHGVEKYRFLANLDDRTCLVCGALDGKTFNVDDMQPGVNCPPMHEGCRCTTIAAWDGLEPRGTRFARDPVTHRGIKVPASMTYSEYEKEYLQK